MKIKFANLTIVQEEIARGDNDVEIDKRQFGMIDKISLLKTIDIELIRKY